MPEDGAPSKEETQGTPAGTENAGTGEVDFSKFSVEELLEKVPGLAQKLQSEKDREAARIERAYRERSREASERARRDREEREFDRYIESEDYEGLGKRTADERRREQELLETTRMVSGTIETELRKRYESLGEDTINKVFDSIRETKGNVIDFSQALAREAQTRAIEKTIADAKAAFQQELDAKMQEYGLSKRTENEEAGNAPSKSVSGQAGSTSLPKSDAELLERFGRGEDVPLAEAAAILERMGISTPAGVRRKK